MFGPNMRGLRSPHWPGENNMYHFLGFTCATLATDSIGLETSDLAQIAAKQIIKNRNKGILKIRIRSGPGDVAVFSCIINRIKLIINIYIKNCNAPWTRTDPNFQNSLISFLDNLFSCNLSQIRGL